MRSRTRLEPTTDSDDQCRACLILTRTPATDGTGPTGPGSQSREDVPPQEPAWLSQSLMARTRPS